MLLPESKFIKEALKKQSSIALLPQDNGSWCLAVKVSKATAYLANSTDSATEFETSDKAISYAHTKEIGDLKIFTGAKKWAF